MHRYIQNKYLSWLYVEDCPEEEMNFDTSLVKMPDFCDTDSEDVVDYGHVVDRHTLKLRIQIMMHLYALQEYLNRPLSELKHCQT
eukprot:Nk52_evm1s2040 gene=Nk52_evmTU1s2040